MTNETRPAQDWIQTLKERLLAGLVNAAFTIVGLGVFIYFTVISQGTRIKAVEDITEVYLPRFIKLEQQVIGQDADITEIKDSQIRTEQKVDRILERL